MEMKAVFQICSSAEELESLQETEFLRPHFVMQYCKI